MAMQWEFDPTNQKPELSEESQGLKPWGESIRDYKPVANTKWRFGLPNYSRVNQLYFEGRSKKHAANSLEAVVEKVVKNWEVETHHISDVNQWQTVDVSKLTVQLNGNPAVNAQFMCDVGPYNMLIGQTKEYSGKDHTFVSANTVFSEAFNKGFAFEVLEVLSGPPNVVFKWRHWGPFSGSFTDSKGDKHVGKGEEINVIGMCIAKVNASLVIEALDVYYDPRDLLKPLTLGKL